MGERKRLSGSHNVSVARGRKEMASASVAALANVLSESVLKKQELSGLDKDFVIRAVRKYLEADPRMYERVAAAALSAKGSGGEGESRVSNDVLRDSSFVRNASVRRVQKEVRAFLRDIYGAFWLPSWKKRERLLENVLKHPGIEEHRALLRLHRSTNERVLFYERLYADLFAVTGKPKKILDLGSGHNVFSYPFLGCAPTYHVHVLSRRDAEFVKRYLRGRGIAGDVFFGDLTKGVPEVEVDVVFLFKLLDVLETQKRGCSVVLLEALLSRSSWVVVSFSTESLSGKAQIPLERRRWFLRWLEKKESAQVVIPNEAFYLVKGERKTSLQSKTAPFPSRKKQ